jgi:beta-1,4-mannosyltransferase
MRIAVYQRLVDSSHPYFRAFHAALSKRGVSLVDGVEIDVAWLKANAGRVDGVHLHWPETIWRSRDFGQLRRFSRALRTSRCLLQLHSFLSAARRVGMKRIWTVHNLQPHEAAYRWDRYGYGLVARESDVIICHSQWSADIVRQHYRPRGCVVVMPIGELASSCPAARPRSEVLCDLGLDPRLPLVSCLGRLREYKGLDLACDAIELLDGAVQLLIGGVRQAGFDLTPMLQAAERRSGIVVIARRLSEQEMADLTAASDAVLLPYRKITSSAALLSALGFGRGVIASDLAYFREILAPEPDAGVVVQARDARAWATAITDYLSRPADARRRAALRLADRYSWDRCVEPAVAAFTA